MELKTTSCCGLKEYDGLTDDPKISLATMCQYRFERGYESAFILFTDPVINGRGEALKKLILELKVGIIVETDKIENPNTGKLLKAYIFTPNDKMLKEWYSSHLEEQNKPDFKVGDIVEALPNEVYSITRNGWRGKIIAILNTREMKVEGQYIQGARVLKIYFKKIDA